MTPELTDKACKYLFDHPDKEITDVFNEFCDRNGIDMTAEDAFYLIDIFQKLSKTDEISRKNFLKIIEESE